MEEDGPTNNHTKNDHVDVQLLGHMITLLRMSKEDVMTKLRKRRDDRCSGVCLTTRPQHKSKCEKCADVAEPKTSPNFRQK